MPTLTCMSTFNKHLQLPACFLAIFFLLVNSGCEKVALPEPKLDAPDFYTINLQINNQSKNWIAGEQNIYMHTNIIPFNDSLEIYTGSFGPTTCDTCASSIHFDFVERKNLPQITVGNFDYLPAPAATQGVKVKVTWDTQGGISPLTSIFNPGDGSTFANFQNGSTYQYTGNGPYTMKLNLSDALNRTVTTEQHIGSSVNEDVALEIQHIDSADILIASVNQPGPISYLWSNGSNNSTLPLSSGGAYSVTATLSNGTQLSQSIHFTPGIQPSVFRVQLKSTRINNTNIAPGQIRIRYFDNNDQLWSSALGLQGLGDFFQVSELIPYPEKDRAGRIVYQARVRFSCKLYNVLGDSIPVTGEAWLAVPNG